MKRFIFILLISSILLSGCASSSTAPEMTLEQAAYQDGDLPEGYIRGEARKAVADSFNEITLPEPRDSIFITLDSEKKMGNANRGGNINILLYDKASDMNEAYEQLSAILIASTGEVEEVEGLGENSAMARFELEPVLFTNIAFTRCNAVVYLLLTDKHDVAVSYLKNVDRRLKKAACP